MNEQAKELEQLSSLILTQNPDVSLKVLAEFYDAALPLDFIVRTIVGMDEAAVKERFTEFLQKHPQMSAKQIRFMSLLQTHIAKFGSIEVERLYEDPFTHVDPYGLDGVFGSEEADEIEQIIRLFGPPSQGAGEADEQEAPH